MGCRLFLLRITRLLVVSTGLAWTALLIVGYPAGKEENFMKILNESTIVHDMGVNLVHAEVL
jgi:hypothetical protein